MLKKLKDLTNIYTPIGTYRNLQSTYELDSVSTRSMRKYIKLDREEFIAIEAVFYDIEFNTWQRSWETVLTQLYRDFWRLGKCYGLYQVEIV